VLYELVTSAAAPAEQPAIVTAHDSCSWAELAELTSKTVRLLAGHRGQRLGVQIEPSPIFVAVLAALEQIDSEAILVDARLEESSTELLAGQLGLQGVIRSTGLDTSLIQVSHAAGATTVAVPGGVTILTSGTTGIPKAVRHDWSSLARPVRRAAAGQDPQAWLLTYRSHLYAGLQVLLQCLVNYGTLVVPPPEASPDDIVGLAERAGVQYISGTPSYLRRLTVFGDAAQLRRLAVRQITLGGESIDQQILDQLATLFPNARIAHIYATTELGRCFSVIDGRAGFPRGWLGTESESGVALRVENGELFVRSANAMQEYDRSVADQELPTTSPRSEWFATGDLIEVTEDRVYFVGRRSDMINVGGNKVSPTVVEDVIRGVPGVTDVRVYGQTSSLTGQLVACDIVPARGQDPDELRSAAAMACHDALASFQRPRFIELVDRIQLTSAGKTRRPEGPDEAPRDPSEET